MSRTQPATRGRPAGHVRGPAAGGPPHGAAKQPEGNPPPLRLESVTKQFGDTTAVDRVSVDAAAGELLTVLGPSGCGKSTLLRLIAGLTPPDAGRVVLAGQEVAGPSAWTPPERRGVGVVFQDYALFPHLTVAGNVGFGVAGRESRRSPRVREVLEATGLAGLADRYPHELSGGEAQRVALARSLAPRPAIVLLDEPFSNLDRNLRVRIREDTISVLRAVGATGVFVTHDQEEALAVGDRVAVVSSGRIEQLDLPSTVFHAPTNRFVATFIGEADFVRGRQAGTTAVTRFGEVHVAGDHASGAAGGAAGGAGGDAGGDAGGMTGVAVDSAAGAREVDVMVRPHEVSFTVDPAGEAVIASAEFRGAAIAYGLDLGDGWVRSLRPHTQPVAVGTRVRPSLDAGHPLAAFPAGE